MSDHAMLEKGTCVVTLRPFAYGVKPFGREMRHVPAGTNGYVVSAEPEGRGVTVIKLIGHEQTYATFTAGIAEQFAAVEAYVPSELWFACLTGDCPHETQAECDAWIRNELLEQAREAALLRAQLAEARDELKECRELYEANHG